MIALAHYYIQVNGAAELVAHARRTNAHQLDQGQGIKNCKFLQIAVDLNSQVKEENKAELITVHAEELGTRRGKLGP